MIHLSVFRLIAQKYENNLTFYIKFDIIITQRSILYLNNLLGGAQ